MKKTLLSALAMALAAGTFAQVQRICGTPQHEAYLEQKNPKRANQRVAYEQAIQKYLQDNPQAKSSQTVVNIPLVVHLVYANATQNISDAQIYSQIAVLNADYTRTNADASNTPAPFAAVASAPMINFCWAQRDPNGNPTNGIERRQTTVSSWTTDDKVKAYSTGGLDAWDPSKYFNIWVCNLGGGLLGYGEFPTGSLSQTYGFVAGYFCFGDTLQVTAPYNKGRTATHEIGHCFNLFHIWGDDGGACTGDDQCADTPNQGSENYSCPTYPLTDACSPTAPGVMFMNYMDYVDDGCMNTFTADQSARMVAVINSAPYNSLLTSNACTPLALPPNDAGITSILQPSGSVCAATTVPQVVIKNWGTNTLSSATINYQLDGGTTQTQAYSGSLASLATATVALPSLSLTAGTHTLNVFTTSPNGTTDGDPSNDAATPDVFNMAAVGSALPLVEGFESTTFPPAGWSRNNPDNATTWARTTAASKSGTASAYMDNYNYNASGQWDDLITPAVNLSQGSGNQPMLTFQVAYQLYTNPSSNPNYSDTLNVMISTDCGATYTSIYKKYGVNLTTIVPTYNSGTTPFVPAASNWRQETISLSSYATAPSAIIKFHHTTDYENQMYIDDINIDYSNGIAVNAALSGVSIYPNPSADGKFFVDIKNESKVHKLTVYDVLGNKVYEISQNIPVGLYVMTLDNLNNGTYLVEIVKDNKPAYTKIIINK